MALLMHFLWGMERRTLRAQLERAFDPFIKAGEVMQCREEQQKGIVVLKYWGC